MSRIGKRPVSIPGGVTAAVDGQEVKIKGPKGELKHVLVDAILAKIDKDNIEIAWWLSSFPGFAIFVTVMGYNMLGEGIRDAIDPRLRS